MALDRSLFPFLDDDQWKAIDAAHNSEVDRRVRDGVETNRKGLFTAEEVTKQVNDALSEAQRRAEMDANQLLDAQRKDFDLEKASFYAERRTYAAKTKLLEGGIPADKVDALLPMFAGVDDAALEATITAFVGTFKDSVKGQVDETKQHLLNNGTPPAGSTAAPVGTEAQAHQLLESGDTVGAVDLMLQGVGLVPAPAAPGA